MLMIFTLPVLLVVNIHQVQAKEHKGTKRGGNFTVSLSFFFVKLKLKKWLPSQATRQVVLVA